MLCLQDVAILYANLLRMLQLNKAPLHKPQFKMGSRVIYQSTFVNYGVCVVLYKNQEAME